MRLPHVGDPDAELPVTRTFQTDGCSQPWPLIKHRLSSLRIEI